MFRAVFFSIFLIAGAANANSLSTIGTPGNGGTLYACSTVAAENPNPSNGKSYAFITQCYKVADQQINPEPSKARALSPGANLDNVVASFFWYQTEEDMNNKQRQAEICAGHIDHFKDCAWADDLIPDGTMDKAAQIVKDQMALPMEDLTSDEHFGCAVALCLANPNGWESVNECHAPIHKLFRVLASTRQFPQCKM